MTTMTTTTFLSSGISPTNSLLPLLSRRTGERLLALADLLEQRNNAVAGEAAAYRLADDDWHAERSDRQRAEQRYATERDHGGVTEDQIQLHRDREARSAARRSEAERRHQAAIAARAAVQTLLAASRRLLEGKRTYVPLGRKPDGSPLANPGEVGGALNGVNETEVQIELPTGDPAKVKEKQRAQGSRIKREIEAVEDAPLPLDNALASARAEVTKEATRAKVRVELEDERRGLRLAWPTRKINADPSRDDPYHSPVAVDAAAIACRFFRDEVLADVEASIRAQYEGIPLALTPSEKRKRLRELKAALLEAERIEAEAIWQIGDGSFRADTDPRAVLGIA
ncbi:hypothetical protein ATER59S_01678 [Aquamicrobium terrae]